MAQNKKITTVASVWVASWGQGRALASDFHGRRAWQFQRAHYRAWLNTMTHILIVEDEAVIAMAVKRLLERHSYEVVAVSSVGEAEESIRRQQFELVIADLRLPDGLGTDVIRTSGNVPVLIMTSYASVTSAVDSMKKGAVDYIPKPFKHEDMAARVERILSRRAQGQAVAGGRPRQDQASVVGGMVGKSAAMRKVFGMIAKVAPTDSTVLIWGNQVPARSSLHVRFIRVAGVATAL